MIIVNLDVMMARRKISLNELSERVGITIANLSILKTGKAKAVRFSTLVTIANLSILKTGKAKAVRFSTLDAICRALDCTPGDILEYRND